MAIHGLFEVRILFLVRAYNDIDHFTPIISYLSERGYDVKFGFTSRWQCSDYHVQLCEEAGASQIRFPLLQQYHYQLRPKLFRLRSSRVWDWLVALPLGLYYLLRFRPQRLVVEWGGPSGRDLARYLLAPAEKLGIKRFSLPHGYHIWTNEQVTEAMVSLGPTHPKFDFKNRSRFTAYVVQSENAKKFSLKRNISETTIKVLGSPRFSKEWSKINLSAALAEVGQTLDHIPQPYIVTFLGNWNYRIDRDSCLRMLSRLEKVPNLHIVIKGHSRGDLIGGLKPEELKKTDLSRCTYAEETLHSNCLISSSAAVINFASSIGFEAMLQGIPICDPIYLTENSTIFTESDLIFTAGSEDEVIDFAQQVAKGKTSWEIDRRKLDEFLNEHVLAGRMASELLSNYERLICQRPIE